MKLPHFAVPFRFTGRSMEMVEQNSAQEIRQCVLAAISTKLGSRIEAPDYGIPDETFKQLQPHPDPSALLALVEEMEPRATLIGEAEVEEMVERVLIELGVTRG